MKITPIYEILYKFKNSSKQTSSQNKKILNLNKLTLITILKTHSKDISYLNVLNDGRLISASKDALINIYNKNTFQIENSIKEHKDWITDIIQLKNGNLISCSDDKTVKFYNKNLKVIQNFVFEKPVLKLKELLNKNIIFTSENNSILIYNKDLINDNYQFNYKIEDNDYSIELLEIKKNFIVTINYKNSISFFDLNNRKKINNIKNLDINKTFFGNHLCLINKNILLICGTIFLYLIDINNYQIINEIKSNFNLSLCLLNNFNLYENYNNYLLIIDNKYIKQYKIVNNNIELMSSKINKFYDNIVIQFNNDTIISGGIKKLIHIWK